MSHTHTTYEQHGDGTGTVTRWWTLPDPESYRPSGDVEAVLAEIAAGESDGGPDFAAPPAETFGSVAEHRKRLAAAQLREGPASERDDPAAMEHSDPYGWTNDGIGCGRCHTYRMQCERSDCPGASRWGGDDPAAVEHEAKRQAWLARVQRCDRT